MTYNDAQFEGRSHQSLERTNLVEGIDESIFPPRRSAPPQDFVLMRFEELVEAILFKSPPSLNTSDPDWLRLFAWCHKHRASLSTQARLWGKLAEPRRVDVWLRELASPPNGTYLGVRRGAISYIRMVGLPPRGDGEPLFTGAGK
jgi:hypothetical protein